MNLQSSRSGKFYPEGGSRLSGEVEHHAQASQNNDSPNHIDVRDLDDELLSNGPLPQQ